MELTGTPDMVLEVVSPGSVAKDTRALRAAYHAAGIPENWLVDVRGREIKFEILVRHAKAYKPVRSVPGWHSSGVYGRHFRLVCERDPVGESDYILEVR